MAPTCPRACARDSCTECPAMVTRPVAEVSTTGSADVATSPPRTTRYEVLPKTCVTSFQNESVPDSPAAISWLR